MGLSLLGLIALVVIVTVLFINVSPQFGGSPTKEQKQEYAKTGHYEDGKFFNRTPTSMDMGFGDMMKTMREFIKGVPNSEPNFELPLEKVDSTSLESSKSKANLVWFGHSAFLLQINGLNILIDPMLGKVPAPHPWLSKGRYSKELPIEIEKLPKIDLILISHDHYDHLDYPSIEKLKDKTDAFYVPLGVGAHLKRWGITESKITEMAWWGETSTKGLTLAFTPSRHFSGRGFGDRWATLWGSWVIQSEDENIYFSGDGGYGPHFKKIGEQYGPFDIALMECGQYNEKWRDIHMMPEETAQAAIDVNTKVMMPIHWGAFTLALHAWNDPAVRAEAAAAKLGIPMITPVIGQQFPIKDLGNMEFENWWKVKP